jgi:carbamoylphosphate synthase large subunit
MKMNVLITGCSRHSKGIVDCLNDNNGLFEVNVYGVDSNENNLLRTGLTAGFVVPLINSNDYIPTILKICLDNDINVILPYITSELELMAKNKALFESNGIKVSVSSIESLAIANDKIRLQEMYQALMPKQYVVHSSAEISECLNLIDYPKTKICCKLSNKCGGAGFAIVDDFLANDISKFNVLGVNRYISLSHLMEIADQNDLEIILQEYVEGKDYSVAVVSDKGNVLRKCGYVGHSMHFGAVINGEIVYNQQAYDIVDMVVSEIQLDGNSCFDFIIKEDGTAVLLEINPRLNASLPFIAAAGFNMPLIRCMQLLGYDLNKLPTSANYGLRMNKYYEATYF